MLTLQELNFTVKDRTGCKNQVADNLSRLEVKENVKREVDIHEYFPDDHVFEISLKHAPWYVDFENYIVFGLMPHELNIYKKRCSYLMLKNTSEMNHRCFGNVFTMP